MTKQHDSQPSGADLWTKDTSDRARQLFQPDSVIHGTHGFHLLADPPGTAVLRETARGLEIRNPVVEESV